MIALVALAGMAMADVTEENAWKEITTTYTLNTLTNTYDLDYAIDLSKAWSVTLSGTADFSQNYNQYGTLPVTNEAATVHSSNGPIRIYLSANKEIVVHPTGSGSENKNSVSSVSGNVLTYSITLFYDPNGASIGNGRIYLNYLVSNEEGQTAELTGKDHYWSKTLTGSCDTLYAAFNAATQTNWTTPQITVTQMIPATPEPATATLSLLALAGLASRRRRH